MSDVLEVRVSVNMFELWQAVCGALRRDNQGRVGVIGAVSCAMTSASHGCNVVLDNKNCYSDTPNQP
eukprot:scaffold151379_cov33-Tisochrysis_lutea.AAC.3